MTIMIPPRKLLANRLFLLRDPDVSSPLIQLFLIFFIILVLFTSTYAVMDIGWNCREEVGGGGIGMRKLRSLNT